MRRTAFIALPLWTAELWLRRTGAGPDPEGGKDPPRAFIASKGGADRVAALNAAGFSAGLSPGQTLADARALAPDLLCAPYDAKADEAALRRLALGAGRYSPAATPVLPDPAQGVETHGLFLDAEGATHLFGGEAAWLEVVLTRLRAAGFSARGALADSPACAYGLAVFARVPPTGLIAAPAEGFGLMAPLPAAALRLPPAAREGLAALGLKTVEAVAAAPRAGLARRFGSVVAARLDAARGAAAEALTPAQPPPVAQSRLIFAAPLTTLEALETVAAKNSADLARRLGPLGLGARRLQWLLYRVDARALLLTCAAAVATQDPARIARLLKERLARAGEGLDLGFGVEAAVLTAVKPEPLAARETGGLAEEAGAAVAAGALSGLAERLAARLGPQALRVATPRAGHWPERAQRFASGLAPAGRAASWAEDGPERPPWLLSRPEPVQALAALPDAAPARFRWRRVLHRVTRAEGPERIAAEWWRADGPTRDYYRVETAEGRRYWLFREGLYGRETETPKWFVHGCWP